MSAGVPRETSDADVDALKATLAGEGYCVGFPRRDRVGVRWFFIHNDWSWVSGEGRSDNEAITSALERARTQRRRKETFMIKRDELNDPTSCLNKAGKDEPLFVLRGKDPHAPETVRAWARAAALNQPDSKIREALALADKMDEWRTANTRQPKEEPAPAAETPAEGATE